MAGLPLCLTLTKARKRERKREIEKEKIEKIVSSGKYLRAYANIEISGVAISAIYFKRKSLFDVAPFLC